MRTKNFLMHLFFGALLLTTGKMVGQSTTPGNVNSGAGDFLGWNNTFPANNFPLQVRHDLNQPIQFITAGLEQVRLLNPQTYNIGSFSMNRAGLLVGGVGQFYTESGPGPYSWLHIADGQDNAQQASFRPWMGVGLTLTGNADHSYFGQKVGEQLDYTDVVLHWSDNPTKSMKDRMRFIFTMGYNSANTTGASSWEGLEAMRMFPVNEDEVNIGLGDWYAGNIADPMNVIEPTERLDVLNGRVRIRQLPTDAVSTSNEYVTVNTTTGVLEHRPLPPSTTTGCDWMIGSGMVSTATAAVGTNGACPDAGWKVLMGPGSAGNYKLAVRVDQPNCPGCGVTGGTNVEMTTKVGNSVIGSRVAVAQGSADSTLEIRGLKIETLNASKYNYGLDADVQSSVGTPHRVYGAWLRASTLAGGNALQIAGFRASGAAGAGTTVGTTVGIWGKAGGGSTNYSVFGENAGTTASDWAGYFSGRTYSPGGVWTASDNNLKTEVESLTNATEKILTLRPKTYLFNTESYPQMGLPEGLQFGFLASDLQEQFPEMVIETTQPAEEDHTGQAVQPAVHFRAVNTSGILPLVVGALQEEHIARVADAAEQHLRLESLEARVNEQSARLADLEHQLAACCANPDGVRSLPQGNTEPTGLGHYLTGTEKLRIQPNPFNVRTTVYYTLDRGGRTQLLANSSDSRDLRVLHEASLEAGSYQFEWDTTALAPGMYYVTLLLNGQPVVKKAVKVDR